MRIIVMMGKPGSGKGTLSEKLADKYGYTHISMGDLLRARALVDDKLGRDVKEMMDNNVIGSDHLVSPVLKERLVQEPEDSTIILDGYPRTLEQAGTLEHMLDEEGYELEAVIALQVSDEVVIERILGRGRNEIDRDREKILTRLFDYNNLTLPVIECFEEKGRVKKIRSDGSIEENVARIERALGLNPAEEPDGPSCNL